MMRGLKRKFGGIPYDLCTLPSPLPDGRCLRQLEPLLSKTDTAHLISVAMSFRYIFVSSDVNPFHEERAI